MTLKMKTAALGMFGTGAALIACDRADVRAPRAGREIRPGQTDHAERHRLED